MAGKFFRWDKYGSDWGFSSPIFTFEAEHRKHRSPLRDFNECVVLRIRNSQSVIRNQKYCWSVSYANFEWFIFYFRRQ